MQTHTHTHTPMTLEQIIAGHMDSRTPVSLTVTVAINRALTA